MDQERKYKWIQDRVHDLHSGTLSDTDRVQLEELAKDDPFLMDALDGYKQYGHHNHIPHLRTLSHRIKNKSGARRRKLLPTRSNSVMHAVAASLVLILVTWTVIYYLGKDSPAVIVAAEQEMSVTEHDANESPEQMEDGADNDLVFEQADSDVREEPPGLRANAQSKASEAKAEGKAGAGAGAGAEAEAEAEAKAKAKAKVAASESAGTENKKVTEEVAPPQPASAEEVLSTANYDEGLYANQMNPAIMAQRVTGQVIDAYGHPVTGAFIAIPNSNLISTSNQFGKFEIFLPDMPSPVEVSSSGYNDTLLTLTRAQKDLVVILQPDIKFETYSVTPQAQNRSGAESKTINKKISASFTEYLKSNSQFAIPDKLTSTSKQVMVEFIIADDGRPKNVKAIKARVEKKYITEAIRLIENGPDWSCEEAYPCKKEYSIYFQ